MTRLLDALADRGIGLLITVDEVRADLNEMVQLAAAYQHFVRERRLVALLMAGLPDPFFLEGVVRRSVRAIVCRELISNTLIHREYPHLLPAKLVIFGNSRHTQGTTRVKLTFSRESLTLG